MEGVDFGCAYVWRKDENRYKAVAQRGISGDLAEELDRRSREPICGVTSTSLSRIPSAINTAARSFAIVPIKDTQATVAKLLVGSSTYAQLPSVTVAALDLLSRMASSALERMRARQFRNSMRSELEALLDALPVPALRIDETEEEIQWNSAASQVFGWNEKEVLQALMELPTGKPESSLDSFLRSVLAVVDEGEHEFRCLNKQGALLHVVAITIPPPRLIGPQQRSSGRIMVVKEAVEVASPHVADGADQART